MCAKTQELNRAVLCYIKVGDYVVKRVFSVITFVFSIMVFVSLAILLIDMASASLG